MNGTSLAQSTTDDAHLLRCWAIQDCTGCLTESDCSWCPFSWTCVPNPYRIQLLAPAWKGDDTCPHWAERWEIRTRPLGCQVSTITTLTSLVTIACTLLVVFVVWLAGVALRRLVAYNTRHPEWWKIWRLHRLRWPLRVETPGILGVEAHTEGQREDEPLLPYAQGAEAP